MKIKLYFFFGCDWYAAKNLRDAIRCVVDHTGCTIRDALDEHEIVPDHELDRLKFFSDQYNEIEECSFREQLQKLIDSNEKFPVPFASTEY